MIAAESGASARAVAAGHAADGFVFARSLAACAILKSPASQIKLNGGSHVRLFLLSLVCCTHKLLALFSSGGWLVLHLDLGPESHFTACDRRW